jgi:hypothetical protein
MSIERAERANAVIDALGPLCSEPHEYIYALSDALINVYVVAGADMTERRPFVELVDLFRHISLETYDGFMQGSMAAEKIKVGGVH